MSPYENFPMWDFPIRSFLCGITPNIPSWRQKNLSRKFRLKEYPIKLSPVKTPPMENFLLEKLPQKNTFLETGTPPPENSFQENSFLKN